MSPNITALILLIASAGAVFGLINPQYAKYQVLSESKAQYQTAADQAKKVREVREKLISSASNISSLEKDRFQKFFDPCFLCRRNIDENIFATPRFRKQSKF